MAEFILDLGTMESHQKFDDLPPIVQGFLEAAFFTAATPADSGEGAGDECPACNAELESSDCGGFVYCPATGCAFVSSAFDSSSAGVGELTESAFAGIAGAVLRFRDANARLIEAATRGEDYDENQFGRDLYYESAGCGVGFADRAELPAALRAHLSAHVSRTFSEISLYTGDDMRIHATPCPAPYAEPITSAAPPLARVGSRYGAPMGRPTWHAAAGLGVHAVRVTLDAGGYDAGGAYFGIGAPLFRIVDESGLDLAFIRSTKGPRGALSEFKESAK